MPAVAASGGVTSRVSVSASDRQGSADTLRFGERAAVSKTGRFVAFTSVAADLVAGDTNGTDDVFVRDRLAGVTERVSVGNRGQQGNDRSGGPAISADGRFVAFDSDASNLVRGDTNESTDVFLRDRVAKMTYRVSVGPAGRQAESYSYQPAISANGAVVAFSSAASNLVTGDTNGAVDVYVRDLFSKVTRRVSVGGGGQQGNADSTNPAISADGQFVAFLSLASNLVPGGTIAPQGVYLRDRLTGSTRRVSVSSSGEQANDGSYGPAISANGRFIAFASDASNLVPGDTNESRDVFVRDRVAGVTTRVSVATSGEQAGSGSEEAAISADGRFIAFTSYASDLVRTDTNGTSDVFLRDRLADVTRRVSVGSSGQQGNGSSRAPAISPDGRCIVFTSDASNLVAGDTNDLPDVFARDRALDS